MIGVICWLQGLLRDLLNMLPEGADSSRQQVLGAYAEKLSERGMHEVRVVVQRETWTCKHNAIVLWSCCSRRGKFWGCLGCRTRLSLTLAPEMWRRP